MTASRPHRRFPRHVRISPLAAAIGLALAPIDSFAASVTNCADSGAGSLRQAISDANAACGSPTISFNILPDTPGCSATAPFVIAPSSPLPTLQPAGTCAPVAFSPTVTAETNGSWQANGLADGFNAKLPVIIDGTVASIEFGSFCGLEFFDPYGGTLALRGLDIRGFAGTGACGQLDVRGSSFTSNQTGLFLQDSSVVGGAAAAERNVFGNNSFAGIDTSFGADVIIRGNFFGTLDGTTAGSAPNLKGMYLSSAGSLTEVSGNVISGNSVAGIYAFFDQGSRIFNNRIGTDAAGTGMLPNEVGIVLEYAYGTSISNNTIANNSVDGVLLLYDGNGNAITQNAIYANGNKNININDNVGPLPNDPGDGDGGPNNQQNYPIVNSVTQAGGQTTIAYTLDSTPGTSFHLEIFSNPAAGSPAGRTYIGSSTVTTPSTGPTSVTGTATLAGLHDNISMTATRLAGTTLTDTSELSPIVPLTPTPAVTLSATSLAFGTVSVGTTSAPGTVTLQSSGTAPYMISRFDSSALCYGGSLCAGGDFMCATTCATAPSAYSPGASCTVEARFAPNVPGPQTTTIYICDNAAGSPRTITLTGEGVLPPPVAITPSSHDFGSILVGASSARALFVVSNPGSSPATIGPPGTTGDFVLESTDCGLTLAGGSGCMAWVSFAPTQPGPASGTLAVPIAMPAAMSAGGAKTVTHATASLSGNGIQRAELALPPSVSLGSYTLGEAPLSTSVELRNTGNAVLTFSSIAASAPFTLANNCPLNLGAGESCTVLLGFSTTEEGEHTGTLTVVSNAEGGSRAIPLTVIAQPRPVPIIRVSPVAVSFGDRLIGTTSATQRVTVRNEGGAAGTISVAATTLDFLVVNTTCGLTLAPQSSCFADVAFRPVGFGPRAGHFAVASNSAESPQRVDLFGIGCRPFIVTGNRSGARSNCAP